MDITEITVDNVSDFENDIDGDILENIGRKFYKGVVAQNEGEFLGAIIWDLRYVDDIYHVTESRIDLFEVNDSEAGKNLIEYYTRTLEEDEVEKSSFELPNSDENIAFEVLREQGFSVDLAESSEIIVSVSDLLNLPLAQKKNIPGYIKSLSELSPRTYRRGIVDCMFHIQREVLDDLDELSIEWYEPSISCYEETDGDVSGYLLGHKCSSGKLRMELLADWGPDAQKALLHMIRFAIRCGGDNYPEDTQVIINRHDESTINLTNYLFPNATGTTCMKGERLEEL